MVPPPGPSPQPFFPRPLRGGTFDCKNSFSSVTVSLPPASSWSSHRCLRLLVALPPFFLLPSLSVSPSPVRFFRLSTSDLPLRRLRDSRRHRRGGVYDVPSVSLPVTPVHLFPLPPRVKRPLKRPPTPVTTPSGTTFRTNTTTNVTFPWVVNLRLPFLSVPQL